MQTTTVLQGGICIAVKPPYSGGVAWLWLLRKGWTGRQWPRPPGCGQRRRWCLYAGLRTWSP